ncbi:MAG: DUF177 domain-containing protein [Candidatus Poribacteria bacterium]
MLRLMLDEIQEGASSLDIECSPEDIDLEYDGVVFTNKVSIKLNIFRQISNVYIKAIISTDVEMECGRCLEPVLIKLNAVSEVQYSPLPRLARDKIDDIGIGYYSEEYIDISGEIGESLLLELPMTVLCYDDCKGLCLSCGKNLNSGACNCPKPDDSNEPDSPVFSRLLELKRKLEV